MSDIFKNHHLGMDEQKRMDLLSQQTGITNPEVLKKMVPLAEKFGCASLAVKLFFDRLKLKHGDVDQRSVEFAEHNMTIRNDMLKKLHQITEKETEK